VTYEALVAAVGEERYRAACEYAGREGEWPKDLAMVPHELSDLWDDASVPIADRLALALRFHAEMPRYAHLMYLKSWYRDLGPAERVTLWDAYRERFAAGDEHIAYSLWVDFFEDPATVREAWLEMTTANRSASLHRLLEIAGPVPWALKAELFSDLADDPAWHESIRRAITASENDVFGQIDERDAKRWRRRVGG
jgi:hypothetical protein